MRALAPIAVANGTAANTVKTKSMAGVCGCE
jgi:hypothetical protein